MIMYMAESNKCSSSLVSVLEVLQLVHIDREHQTFRKDDHRERYCQGISWEYALESTEVLTDGQEAKQPEPFVYASLISEAYGVEPNQQAKATI